MDFSEIRLEPLGSSISYAGDCPPVSRLVSRTSEQQDEFVKDVADIDCVRVGKQLRTMSDYVVPSPQIRRQLCGRGGSSSIACFSILSKDRQRRFDIAPERLDARKIDLALLDHQC
ncbi:hypothetical protein [Bradyrhizobium elkanii]|uniref:hypothetical protein n=1 Tax=Bradyrhizobium elkanii TaxID=29448 RepID=UPI00056E6553|nr:hypothetical protein [Bradyrhizobium elkanii]